MEQRYQIGNAYGSIVWDIARMLRDADSFAQRSFSVEELARQNPFRGSAEYAMETDPSKPLIVVELAEGKKKLIDGNHRLYKCIKCGVQTVYAYYLSFEEHSRYIVDFDAQTYWSVVNHW